MKSFKEKVIRGVIWTVVETFTTKLGTFLVTLLLARLLTPDDYGTVALLTLIVNMSSVLIDCGLGMALVQKKNATDVDFDSVFWLGLGVSVIIYLVLFLGASWVADFYARPELIPLLRVLALTLIVNVYGGIQGAELQRRLAFDLTFRVAIVRFLVTSSTGISLAVLKYGPWALVLSTLLGGIATVVTNLIFVNWRPTLRFSFPALKELFSFGWKFSASWLLSVAYDNIYGMIVGKVYSPADFAFYEKGRQVPELGMIAVNGTVQRVSFPAMAQIQDERERVRNVMRRMVQCSTFVVFPIMVGIAACADPLVLKLYGGQWGPAIPFTIIMSFCYILYPFHTINLQTISALGRSDIFLKLEVVKKIVNILILVVAYRYGVLVMVAASTFIGGPLGMLINVYPCKKLLGYSLWMQVCDTLPSAIISLIMGGVMYCSRWLPFDLTYTMMFQFLIGIGVYFMLAWLFRLTPLKEYLAIIDDGWKEKMPSFLKGFWNSFYGHLTQKG